MPAARDKIVAIAASLVRRHAIVSTSLYLAGLLGVLTFPLLARKTFIDENAFLQGQSLCTFKWDHAQEAERFTVQGVAAVANSGDGAAGGGGGDATDALRDWAATELEYLQLDSYLQDFSVPGATGRNLHSVAKAPKGDGREGIVLATPIGASGDVAADAAALGKGSTQNKHLTDIESPPPPPSPPSSSSSSSSASSSATSSSSVL